MPTIKNRWINDFLPPPEAYALISIDIHRVEVSSTIAINHAIRIWNLTILF
jgi:hypothetical protein